MSKNFFNDLQDLRERPIPDLSGIRALKQNYRAHPTDAAQALYDEKLVDLKDHGIDGVNHYAIANNPPYYEVFDGSIDRLLARETVAKKLAAIDRTLRANGLKLFVHDAYRPTAIQAYGHDVWLPNKLKAQDPALSDEAITEIVEKFWAKPTTDPAFPSPHKTGGAVDLTIAYLDGGQYLFMGTIFDDVSALAYTDSFEARTGSDSYSDQEAIANRRLLYWLMREAGFANNPTEWWHFSYGDTMWAKLTGVPAALYGAVEPQ